MTILAFCDGRSWNLYRRHKQGAPYSTYVAAVQTQEQHESKFKKQKLMKRKVMSMSRMRLKQ